jgi:hypothetical protein
VLGGWEGFDRLDPVLSRMLPSMILAVAVNRLGPSVGVVFGVLAVN